MKPALTCAHCNKIVETVCPDHPHVGTTFALTYCEDKLESRSLTTEEEIALGKKEVIEYERSMVMDAMTVMQGNMPSLEDVTDEADYQQAITARLARIALLQSICEDLLVEMYKYEDAYEKLFDATTAKLQSE